MFRRDFLKILAAIAAGSVAAYEYFKKEYQGAEQQEAEETAPGKTPEKITPLKTEEEFTDLNEKSKIELFRTLSEYPEMIEKSKKQSPEDFAKDLSKRKDVDSLILTNRGWGADSEQKIAVKTLEELEKNKKKISAICFLHLSPDLPRHIEATEKFNKGELSVEESVKEIIKAIPELGGRESLLEFARKHSIKIEGLGMEIGEDITRYESRKNLPFRTQVSKKAGELVNKYKKDGLVVLFVPEMLGTVASWENETILHYLQGKEIKNPPKKEVLENNYTIKEYLEKIGLNPAAVQIEDWKNFTGEIRWAVFKAFKDHPKHLQEAKKIMEEKYLLEEERDFVAPYPKGGKDTSALVIPGYTPY